MRFSFVLLLAAIFCEISADLNSDWWNDITEIYEILVPAYKDYDGDGIGDFEGIVSKLDYIEQLGVSAIKLSPIFTWSEKISHPYPIEDFKNTHLGAGSLEDFDNLIKEANVRGIRIIMDLVINHCSIEHEWFIKSKNRIEPYTNYFIWTDGNKDGSYSEKSVGATWKWDDTRKQFYYHRFDETTADLNLKNEAVKNEIKDVMKFWLDRGVSGFHLLQAEAYMEDELAKQYEYPASSLVENLPESYEYVHELREYIDNYNKRKTGRERILIVEDKAIEKYPNLRGNETYPMAHIVWKRIFRKDDNDVYWYFKSSDMNSIITNVMKANENGPTMFVLEDSVVKRTPNRFQDRQYVDVWLTTLFMLPGIKHIYYGQEIGISDWKFLEELIITSMQWDDTINSGFTDGELIIYTPNVDYWKVNVKNVTHAEYSTLRTVKDLLNLSKTEAVQHGDLKTYLISEYVFAFSRSYGKEKFIIILNLSNILYKMNLKVDIPEYISGKVRVVSSSPNAIYRKGDFITETSSMDIRPVSAVVLRV